MSSAWVALRPRRLNVRTTRLVSPPVALAIDVFARVLAEVGRADDEDLEALWPGLARRQDGREHRRYRLDHQAEATTSRTSTPSSVTSSPAPAATALTRSPAARAF